MQQLLYCSIGRCTSTSPIYAVVDLQQSVVTTVTLQVAVSPHLLPRCQNTITALHGARPRFIPNTRTHQVGCCRIVPRAWHRRRNRWVDERWQVAIHRHIDTLDSRLKCICSPQNLEHDTVACFHEPFLCILRSLIRSMLLQPALGCCVVFASLVSRSVSAPLFLSTASDGAPRHPHITPHGRVSLQRAAADIINQPGVNTLTLGGVSKGHLRIITTCNTLRSR